MDFGISQNKSIYVVSAQGTGRTRISAFDEALFRAGIHNYNLIYLSSIIPQGIKVITQPKFRISQQDYGHRLYVVKARADSETTGTCVGAAIAWSQNDDGRGVFVEHEYVDPNYTEEQMKEKLIHNATLSLEDLCKRRGFSFDNKRIGWQCETGIVGEKPLCVLVLAVYQAEAWSNKEFFAYEYQTSHHSTRPANSSI